MVNRLDFYTKLKKSSSSHSLLLDSSLKIMPNIWQNGVSEDSCEHVRRGVVKMIVCPSQ